MQKKQWPNPISPIEKLHQEFYRFDFFQAMRVLEIHLKSQANGGPVIGHLVRFRNSLNLTFPPSQIENLVYLGDDKHRDPKKKHLYEVTPAFFGLTGVVGVLPLFYTEKLIEREELHRDYAARTFLDIFTNRMLTLFYQAWKKYRMHVLYEQEPKRYFLPHILSLMGQRAYAQETPKAGSPAHTLPPEVIAYYSGIFRTKTVSPLALERILTEHFRVPIKIQQFIFHKTPIEPSNQVSLHGTTHLGVNSFCGDSMWTRHLKLRLVVGPVSREQGNKFLPNGSAHAALRQLLALSMGRRYLYELRLVLKKEEITGIELSGNKLTQLGWDSFLVSKPAEVDRDDTHFALTPCARPTFNP